MDLKRKYAEFCQNMQKYAKICKHVKFICKNIQNYALPTLLMSLQFHLQSFCAPFLLLIPVAIISYQVKSIQMSKAAAARVMVKIYKSVGS
jgi:hypothetical protein